MSAIPHLFSQLSPSLYHPLFPTLVPTFRHTLVLLLYTVYDNNIALCFLVVFIFIAHNSSNIMASPNRQTISMGLGWKLETCTNCCWMMSFPETYHKPQAFPKPQQQVCVHTKYFHTQMQYPARSIRTQYTKDTLGQFESNYVCSWLVLLCYYDSNIMCMDELQCKCAFSQARVKCVYQLSGNGLIQNSCQPHCMRDSSTLQLIVTNQIPVFLSNQLSPQKQITRDSPPVQSSSELRDTAPLSSPVLARAKSRHSSKNHWDPCVAPFNAYLSLSLFPPLQPKACSVPHYKDTLSPIWSKTMEDREVCEYECTSFPKHSECRLFNSTNQP